MSTKTPEQIAALSAAHLGGEHADPFYNSWCPECVAEMLAETRHPNAPAAKPEMIEGWAIVSLEHDVCEACTDAALSAAIHAKVTGSVGATYNVAGADHHHGATVEREQMAAAE